MTTFLTPRTLDFLRDLAEHNDRDWFEENRDRYEEDWLAPGQRLVLAVGERLDEVSPHLRADPRPQGGSIFRIYRDVRFSNDKSPYKTHLGIQFRHAEARDAHAPGLYLHVEPGAHFFGFGVWRPGGKALRKIRAALIEDPDGWRAAVGGRSFTRTFERTGDRLKRGPRGIDPDHPLIEELKWKDFVGSRTVTRDEILADDLPDRIVEWGTTARPMMAFLCRALGARF